MSSTAMPVAESMVATPWGRSSNDIDDKYDKCAKSPNKALAVEPLCGVCGVSVSCGAPAIADAKAILRSPLQLYLVFLMAASVGYHCLGGNLKTASNMHLLGFASCIMETLGLLSLQSKIKRHGSVKGISGKTMAMYAINYTLRQVLLMQPLSIYALNGWLTELLQVPSIVLVFHAVWSIFKTYRKSYQEDLDVMKLVYLVPGCILVALPLHPSFVEGFFFSWIWTSYLYMDILGLLPQVVMMSRGNGKVEAPIAHFVAATAFSRMVDLWFWFYGFDLGPQGYIFGFNYSGWLIVAVHILSLVLIADFMYYYVKAQLSGKVSEDLALPLDDIC